MLAGLSCDYFFQKAYLLIFLYKLISQLYERRNCIYELPSLIISREEYLQYIKRQTEEKIVKFIDASHFDYKIQCAHAEESYYDISLRLLAGKTFFSFYFLMDHGSFLVFGISETADHTFFFYRTKLFLVALVQFRIWSQAQEGGFFCSLQNLKKCAMTKTENNFERKLKNFY